MPSRLVPNLRAGLNLRQAYIVSAISRIYLPLINSFALDTPYELGTRTNQFHVGLIFKFQKEYIWNRMNQKRYKKFSEMNPRYFLLLLLTILSSCSNKKPTPCSEADVYSVIREKKMTELVIVNRNELRFKHSSNKNFPTYENDYCSCLWSSKLTTLEDSLQVYGLNNYQSRLERDYFAFALGWVLPGLILLSLLLVLFGTVMLFREKDISDIQRLTYLILILFVPVVGFVIFMSRRNNKRK